MILYFLAKTIEYACYIVIFASIFYGWVGTPS